MSKLDDKVLEYNHTYKEEIATKGIHFVDVKSIPLTSPTLNYMLHGGFPRGQIVEFFGLESSGKTTTAIDVCANAQKVFKEEYDLKLSSLKLRKGQNKTADADLAQCLDSGPMKVVYFDLEHTFDKSWCQKLGLDVASLYLVSPEEQSAEQLLDMLIDLISTGEVGLIVLDSIPALVSDAELGKTLSEQTMGGVAKLLGTFFRKVIPSLNRYGCSLLIINQLRDSMSMYGDQYVTPGGKALKFYASVRLFFQKGSLIDENGNELKNNVDSAYGNIVQVRLKKSKVFPPDRLLSYYTLSYYNGIRYMDDYASLLSSQGYILQTGSYFTFANKNGEPMLDGEGKPYKVQGKSKLGNFILENKNLKEQYDPIIEMIIKDKN